MFIKAHIFDNPRSDEITPDSIFKIKGFLRKQGVPIVGIVQLLSISSGRIIRVSKSKADGSYEFKGLPKGMYAVLSRDERRQFNAIIQDNVVPK